MFIEEDGIQFEKREDFNIDFNEVKASLRKVRKGTGGWWIGCCQAHPDEDPSLAFRPSGDTTAFKCFAGCSWESIVRSLGMWKDVPTKKERINKRIVKTYDYADENGELKYQVVRYEPKDFRQRRPDGNGDWVYNLEGVPRLLYNLPALVKAYGEPVFVCYTPDTEVLTKTGWVRFDELEQGREIAQYDLSGEISFVVPSAYQTFEYEGELVDFSNSKFCSLTVTPDHRQLVRYARCNYKVVTAENVVRGHALPTSGIYNSGYVHSPSLAQARLLAAMQADGCWERRGNQISFNNKKLRKQERLRSILTELSIEWTEHDYVSSPGWREFRFEKQDWIKEFLPNKKFTLSILNWTLEARQALIEELGYWDGDFSGKAGIRFFTSDKDSAEALSVILPLSGYSHILREQKRPERENHSTEYVFNIGRKKERRLGNTPKRTYYKGLVYCCTVPTSFLLVRKNGKVVVSGNCEGEKDADSLIAQGALATTNSGGAAKWEKTFNKYFANRDVIILPDNDPAGVDHAELISKEIYRIVKSVKIVVLPVEEKGDVTDYFNEGCDLQDLQDICNEVEPIHYTEEELQQDPTQAHNIKAEWAVLGAVIKNPILVGKLIDKKVNEHFYDTKTRLIANAMVKCFEDGEEANYLTVSEKLGKDLVKVGGTDFIQKLDEDLPEIFDVDSWINLIISKSQYRELAKIGKSLSAIAENEGDLVSKITETFASKVYNVKEQNNKSGLERLGDNLETVIAEAQNAVGEGLTGLSTGLLDLDWITSGWQDTDLVIVAGRPSVGKSTIALSFASHAAIKEGKSVAIFSLEMSKKQLISKIICSEAMISGRKLKNGELSDVEWGKIGEILPALNQAQLYIDDTAGISLHEVRSKLMRLKQEEGLDLVVIDYIQLMTGAGENRQQQVSGISRGLKALAKEFKVPVIALSQLNRSPEERTVKRPMLSDLRESGSIEQDADVVVLAYRDDYYNEDSDSKGIVELLIPKHRNGATGTVEVAFLREYSKVLNLFPKLEYANYSN